MNKILQTVAIVREPAVVSSSNGYTAEFAKFFHLPSVCATSTRYPVPGSANTKLDKNDAA